MRSATSWTMTIACRRGMDLPVLDTDPWYGLFHFRFEVVSIQVKLILIPIPYSYSIAYMYCILSVVSFYGRGHTANTTITHCQPVQSCNPIMQLTTQSTVYTHSTRSVQTKLANSGRVPLPESVK